MSSLENGDAAGNVKRSSSFEDETEGAGRSDHHGQESALSLYLL